MDYERRTLRLWISWWQNWRPAGLRDKIITGKPWMKRPQEPLTTMETGGSLSKVKTGDLAGRIWFGPKVVAGGN